MIGICNRELWVFCELGIGSLNIMYMNFKLRIKICNVYGDQVCEFHLKMIETEIEYVQKYMRT
jgi:hypothetical protein